MTVTLSGCQTLSGVNLPPINVPKRLSQKCPAFHFSAGKLMPQIVRLKTQYELCRVNNNGLIELLS